ALPGGPRARTRRRDPPRRGHRPRHPFLGGPRRVPLLGEPAVPSASGRARGVGTLRPVARARNGPARRPRGTGIAGRTPRADAGGPPPERPAGPAPRRPRR